MTHNSKKIRIFRGKSRIGITLFHGYVKRKMKRKEGSLFELEMHMDRYMQMKINIVIDIDIAAISSSGSVTLDSEQKKLLSYSKLNSYSLTNMALSSLLSDCPKSLALFFFFFFFMASPAA